MVDKETNLCSINDSSVYQLIKLLCKHLIKEVDKCKYKQRLFRRLIATSFDVILYSKNTSFDYGPEELHSAILIKASKRFIDGTACGKKKIKKLEDLLARLQLLLPNGSHGFLKFLYLLSDMQCDNQGLNEFKDPFSSVEIEDSLETCKFNPFKEPLFRGLDIDYRMLMLADSHPDDSLQIVYIPRTEILQDIVYALIGVPSSSFSLVNSCLIVREGLISDGIDAITLSKILQPVVRLGNCYTHLSRLPKMTNSLCSSSFYNVLKCFLQLYLKSVLKLKSSIEPVLFTSLLKFVGPLTEKMEFFQSMLNLLPNSKLLLEKSYNFSINDFTRPNTTSLVNIFLLDCCNTYFKFIDSWIFEGSLSKTENLFIKEDSSQIVDSKETWNKVYIYDAEYAPNFLPCLDIFNCGKSVALLKMCSDTDPFVKNLKLVRSDRPNVTLCKNLEELNILNEECNAYVAFIQRLCNFEKNILENIQSKTKQLISPPAISVSPLRRSNSPPKELDTPSDVVNSQGDDDNVCNEVSNVEKSRNIDFSPTCEVFFPSDRNLVSSDDLERHQDVIALIEKENTRMSWEQSRSQVNYRKQYLRKLYNSAGELTFFPNPLQNNDNISEGSNDINQKICRKKEILSTSSEDDSFRTCENFTLYKNRDYSSDENLNKAVKIENTQIKTSITCTETLNSKDSVKDETLRSSTQSFASAETLSDDIKCRSTSSDSAQLDSPSLDLNCDPNVVDEFEWDVSLFIEELENIPLKAKNLFSYGTKFDAEMTLTKNFKTHDQSIIYEDDIIVLRKIIKDSILIPLRMQNKLVNDALIRVFLYEKKFLQCTETLTNKFFLMDGIFSSKLIDHLSRSIENESPTTFLSFSRLLRLTHAIAIDSDKSLSFKINFIPSAFDLSDPSVLSCLSLTYSVDWPLNLLITPTMIEKYDSVFAFLLCVERTFWSLNDLFINLKKCSSIYNSSQFRKVMSQRFIMMQFISAFKSFLQNEVVKDNWTKFHKDLHSIQNLELLYRAHVELVKKVRFMCFLTKANVKLHDELMKLLRVILVYCRIVRDGPWCEDEDGTIKHAKFQRLSHYFQNFIELAKFFIKYIKKLVEFGGKSEFDLLLVMFTLNSFHLSD